MVQRSLIVSILGHVDHGKTSLLDRIRGSAVAAGEAGGITQAIGASIIPAQTIKKLCAPLPGAATLKLTIPGLLLVDTPGHAAFTNLRKRGGALADIAILVVDVLDGFKPQTVESLEILKKDKTPFVVAANKVDLISGWRPQPGMPLLASLAKQSEEVKQKFETKMYELVGKLFELGLQSERFDRVEDYTKQIAIIPTSSLTGEGVAELVMVLSGLAQKFLEKKLEVEAKGPAKGTILEVKEEKGHGLTIDVIIYDGSLKVNDVIVFGSMSGAKETKVRALLEPLPLQEMRDGKSKFKNVKEVFAATGVKIAAPGFEEAVAGMPVHGVAGDVARAKAEIEQDVKEFIIDTDTEGVLIKADTIGALEALMVLLKEQSIQIRSASIGEVNKKDVTKAEAMVEKDPAKAVILAFNVGVNADAQELLASSKVKVLKSEIIYQLIDDLQSWGKAQKRALEEQELEHVVRPVKIKFLPGYVFRQSNPAVVGIEVLAGTLRTGQPLMDAKGRSLSAVKALQEHKESLSAAEVGKQVALSLDKVTVGRQISEGDIFFSDISENDARKLKEFKGLLSPAEREVLKEIAAIKRESDPLWGAG